VNSSSDSAGGGIGPPTEYRCPHCDTVIDRVVIVETVPLIPDDGRRRHTVDTFRRAAVMVAHRRGGVPAVMSDLGVSRSQAYRLVSQSKNGQMADE
jgi:hypothetical protein